MNKYGEFGAETSELSEKPVILSRESLIKKNLFYLQLPG